jgi:phosphoserine phosphatase
MKYKEFSPQIWKTLQENLDLALARDPEPIAAFDADGTLWDFDLGEAFFQYEIDRKLLPLPKDPWEHYERLKEMPGGPQKGYLWLAQIHQGIPIEEVRRWAQNCINDTKPVPIFSEQRKLIELLLSRGVQVYVVTASIKWAVEPGAALFGISPDQVIGVKTQIVDGVVTDQQQGVITYKEGKVQGLLEHTQGKYPFLASGNTEGDFALLSSATQTKLALSAACRDEKLFKTESWLQKKANELGWLSHRFIKD